VSRITHTIFKRATFSEIFAETCNGSPATASMYKEALATLVSEGEVTMHSADGKPRYRSRYMSDTDIVDKPKQQKLFLFDRR